MCHARQSRNLLIAFYLRPPAKYIFWHGGKRDSSACISFPALAAISHLLAATLRYYGQRKYSKMVRGAFIVLEGLDRAGKSTQVSMLLEALKKLGISAEKRVFPDRSTIIGKMIGEYLEKKIEIAPKSVHLLFSANRWECEESICQALTKGTTLVVDRYAASGAAYGAATTDRGLDWCKNLDRGLPAPDLVLYLDVPEEAQEARASWGAERYERAETQRKVRANFRALAPCFNWASVDAARPVDEVHRGVLEKALAAVEACEERPVGKLYES